MRAKPGGLSALFIATLGAIALWIAAGAQRVEAGAFTIDELHARMDEVAGRGATYGEAQGTGE